MTTDAPAGIPTLAARTDGRRFRRTVLVVLVVLTLLAGGLGAASAIRGPQITSGSVNESATVDRVGQRLTLDVDQRIGEITSDDVVVTPAVPLGVTGDGSSVVVTFDGLLRYATEYTVSVALRGADTGIETTSSWSFQTPDADLDTLVRDYRHDADDRKLPDGVVRSAVADPQGPGTTPASAERIEQFASTADMVATVQPAPDGSDELVLFGSDGSGPYPVFTPDGATITSLRAAPDAGLFGYTVNGGTADDGSTYRSALLVYDPTSASGRPTPVLGPDGVPLYVSSWLFVPGTSSIVAQGPDQQLYLVDPLRDNGLTPLGRHVEMRGFLPGTATLIVGDATGDSALDLAAGTTTPWQRGPAGADPADYPGKIVPTSPTSYVQQFDRVDYTVSTAPLGSTLIAVDQAGPRTLFTPPSPGSRISDLCLSPNGQYLAVEVIPADARVDTYAVTGYEGVTTYLVDLATGDSSRSVYGSQPSWCTSF